jgi:hypothetical protein
MVQAVIIEDAEDFLMLQIWLLLPIIAIVRIIRILISGSQQLLLSPLLHDLLSD